MIKMVDDDDQADGWSVSSMTPLPGAAGENKKTTSMLNEQLSAVSNGGRQTPSIIHKPN